ncbi:hypothetical protein BVI434_300007 [Burkholderia vietnamiensis]|nr:hypothetical protein BVI434_300007 [Burkholderia vietnamiensis]
MPAYRGCDGAMDGSDAIDASDMTDERDTTDVSMRWTRPMRRHRRLELRELCGLRQRPGFIAPLDPTRRWRDIAPLHRP